MPGLITGRGRIAERSQGIRGLIGCANATRHDLQELVAPRSRPTRKTAIDVEVTRRISPCIIVPIPRRGPANVKRTNVGIAEFSLRGDELRAHIIRRRLAALAVNAIVVVGLRLHTRTRKINILLWRQRMPIKPIGKP